MYISGIKLFSFSTIITLFLVCLCHLQFIHTVAASDHINTLKKRQEVSITPAASQAQPTTSNNNVQASPTQSNSVVQATNAGSAVVVASGNNSNLAALPTSASYGNSVFNGGISFITPTPSNSVSPLYRVGSDANVTFIWSYTSLLVQPVNLTMVALGPNSVAYTIAAMQGAATSAVWDIGNIPATLPGLMVGFYTIELYDQRGPSAVPSPGWLSPQSSLVIGFYSGEPYSNSTETAGPGCPYCFNDNATSLSIAFGVACLTSVLFIYNLIN